MATLAGHRGRRSKNPLAVEDAIAGWVFILPAVTIFVMFIFGPILYAFYTSFFDRSTLGNRNEYVGTANYREILFDNPDFWQAFRNTTWFTIGVVPTQTAIGLILAVLANRKIRGKTFFRTAFYFPSISSSVVISVIFLWMYQRNGLIDFAVTKLGFPRPEPVWMNNPNGVVGSFLGLFGWDNVPAWLEGPSVALLSIMMLNIWTTAGTMMVIFLAGLQDVPGDVYEAASLDGASRWRQFRDITVPLIRPVTLFVTTVGMIGTFQVFDQIFVMTSDGGPNRTTTTMAYLIYQETFKYGSGLGYGSAMAMLLFALILGLFLLQRRLVGQNAL